MLGKRRRLAAEIDGGRGHMLLAWRCRAVKVAPERRRELSRIGKTAPIGGDTPIEAACHCFDAAADAEIGHTHFAQSAIEIGEHRVKERLREGSRLGVIAAQTVEHEKGMKRQQLEAAVEGVGNAERRIEVWIARPLDDVLESAERGAAPFAAAEQGRKHEDASPE